ncbi:MAG: Ig-like domain-containing protein [Symbiopectobacterium sp.]|uniref:Ig-like domain-containing protein n=1 Tax=Symbiopectobacterium sp. TaxID=2952789 RepID=UPI0039E78D91
MPLASADLSSIPDGPVSVIVTVTDSAGNSSTANGSAEALFHKLPSATLVLPFGDGYLNLEESNTAQTLRGNTGISGSGQTVTVTLDAGTPNQVVFTGVLVDSLGGWSLPLSSTQLDAFTEGGHTITVTVADRAGNSSTSTNVTAALTLLAPDITEPLFGSDNILNIAEASGPIIISGTTNSTGSAQNIDLNGVIYQAVVTGSAWRVTLPANALSSLAESNDHKLVVTATDQAGNSSSDTVTFENDFHAPAVTLDTPFVGGDGLDYVESRAAQTLSGTSTGLEVGQKVTVTVNSHGYDTNIGVGVAAVHRSDNDDRDRGIG